MRRLPETVLLVEDEASVSETITAVLELNGYRVLSAATGAAASAIFEREQGRIDLLLTDIVLPGGSTGLELADQLRQRQPDLKVIFSTGYSSEAVAGGQTLEEGVNFIQKPFATTALLHIIRKNLDPRND